jgi:hypothetical protein
MSTVILRKICPWFLSDISLYIMHIIITFEGYLGWKSFMYVLGRMGKSMIDITAVSEDLKRVIHL